MSESSLQDLRDDWQIGDDVLVETRGYNGGASSLRAGHIVAKESMFATVQVENKGKQKVQYKRLRRVARSPQPASRTQQQPAQPTLLRSVPPALAKLGELPTINEPQLPKTPNEQQLVKLPPRQAPTAAPAAADPRKQDADDITAWLEMGGGIFNQLIAKQKTLQEEHDQLSAEGKRIAREAAQKLAAIKAAQTEIDKFCKLRDFVAKMRPVKH